MPAYYRASFKLDKVGDTFLDMSTWGKGMVWVNGHAMGRFWEIGPQQTLFMPGCWLKEGENEILVLDLKGPTKASIKGLKKPILDVLREKAPRNTPQGWRKAEADRMKRLRTKEPSLRATAGRKYVSPLR